MIQDRSFESLKAGEKLFQDALELDSHFAHAKAELANIIYLLRNYNFVPDSLKYYDRAFELSQEVLQLNPNIARVYEIMGSVSRQRGHFNKALSYFKRALEIDPKDGYTLQRAAIQLHGLRKEEEAMFLIRKALETNPFSPVIHGVYIRMLAQNQEYELAKEQFDLALKLFPNNKTILWHGRVILSAQGKCDELAEYYKNWQIDSTQSSLFMLFKCYCTQENVPQLRKYLVERNSFPSEDLLLARANHDIDRMFAILINKLPATDIHLLIDPVFDILQDDPRFEAYLRQSPFGQLNDADVEAILELIRS